MDKKYLDGFEDLTELEDFDNTTPTFDVYIIEMKNTSGDPEHPDFKFTDGCESHLVAHFTNIDEGRNFAEELYEDPSKTVTELRLTKGVYSIQLLTIVDELDVDCTYKRLIEIF